MKPRELLLLWEVSRTGSVTRAAERTAMTQPAASALIRGVEERLGFALFDRDKRRLTFTAKGRTLLPEIANALAALDSLTRLTGALRSDARQRVVIGCVPPAAATILPSGVRALRTQLPDATVSIRSAMTLDIESMVADGRVDFGIVTREGTQPGPGCLCIAHLPLCYVVEPGHPLARAKSVDMAMIAEHDYVSLGRQFTVGGATARLMESVGRRYDPAVEVMNFSTACAFAAQGGFVAVLDAFSFCYAKQFGLIARRVAGGPDFNLELLWSPHSRFGSHARDLAQGLAKGFGSAARRAGIEVI